MKASLQLRLGQQLTMTPQLQQAIRLLQLSTLDLQQEIQEALESNPLLEADESHSNDSDATEAKSANEKSTEAESSADVDSSQMEAGDAINQETVSDDLPVDSTWDDIYSASSAPASSSSGSGGGDDNDMLFQGETVDSLQDHMLWQMRLTPFSEVDQAIALAIIDAVDESGYLTQDCEQLLDGLNSSDNNDLDVELDEIEAVLKRIQHFDPVGIAARSLQECLLIQLSRFSPETPWLNEAKDVVSNHIDVLANRDFRLLARKTKLKEDQLREVMRLIHTLEPRPGNAVEPNQAQYVIPDVSVVKRQGRWVVELNPDAMPKLRVNSHYASLSKTSNATDTQFIRSHLQEAKWFIKSIESRNETLLKVSNCIVHHQQAFFEYGEEAMKPMVLNDVAEAVEMHESTISRVTTQKFMHTPRGIFELKYFFSSHVATDGGGECSSTAIRALIKKLVAAENTSKPLSDSKIADILADQGIKVARRTIAKYRESLAIPPSNQRKSLL
ncbi:RNA polymerase sigma-54 factor [Agarivorans sp. Toyoura001]|uniref:RNA polymerase factor sigma-54 n=1 Tax=Agarivorans sp. Toyoura001 TaxID=2283141 RepID=UPI0010D25224|nr:RNA polymerase factor sigma-54 [Agarivorans sp. Toyoura001]GDY26499.1 RNA polymerase sigma-54 factor [Agarivorans sp. Toyoura001]